MKHKIHGQMSDSFLTAAFFISFQVVYRTHTHTYSVEKYLPMHKPEIFCLLGINISERNWHMALHYSGSGAGICHWNRPCGSGENTDERSDTSALETDFGIL